MPDDVQLKVLEIAGQSHQVFKETIESLNQDITVSILGAFLQQQTSSGGGDPRGDTKQHRSTVDLQKWFLSAAFLEVVNKQIIPDLVQLNYSNCDLPSATIGGINDQDNLTSAQLDDILVNKLKIPLSLRDAYKRYGRAQPIDPTDAISPQPEPAMGGGGGFGQPPAMAMGERQLVGKFSELERRHGRKTAGAILKTAAELFDEAAPFDEWITIGGKERQGQGKHHGGFPVEIDSQGTIKQSRVGGLQGKNVKDVKGHFDKKRNSGKIFVNNG